jgi:hypothetical protein
MVERTTAKPATYKHFPSAALRRKFVENRGLPDCRAPLKSGKSVGKLKFRVRTEVGK